MNVLSEHEVLRSSRRAIILVLFAISMISCGGPSERIKEIEAVKATPSPTPGERPISGSFVITGSAANGMEPYTGSLTVAPKGDNYEFRWSTTKGSRIGTGVQFGNSIAVSFAATGGGKGCGVVLYKVNTVDGTLEGRQTAWSDQTYSTWRATRTDGTGFPGKYKFVLKSSDGKDYSGDLTIVKDGSGFDFQWIQDEKGNTNEKMVGFGILKGSVAAASFGGRQCNFALYDITSNGSLEGDWGGQAAVTFGAETAKR